MPILTRWFIKTSLAYLVAALLPGRTGDVLPLFGRLAATIGAVVLAVNI
jgi:hypothetical protein